MNEHGGPAADAHALHRTIVCVDVQGFGDLRRTHEHQIAVRRGLHRALDRAFARAGADLRADCHCEDRGDGALILVPPNIPKGALVVDVIPELAAALAEHNHIHDRRAQIHLRMALHAGEVHHDAHGVAGTAVITTARLLDAAPLKRALARSAGALAVIVSQRIFEDVIRHIPASRPNSYRVAHIAVKETETTAWISLPDNPCPPEDRPPRTRRERAG